MISAPLYLINPTYVKYFNISIFFITLFLGLKILIKHFGLGFTIKFILLMLFGSMLTNYIRNFWAEVFSASFLFLGLLYFILENKKFFGIFLITLATANTPALLFPIGLLALYWVYKYKRYDYLFILLFPIIIIMLENYFKYHTFANSGYSNDHGFKTILPYSGLPGFSYPFILGFISIIFSFGKGLLFFTPGAFLVPPKSKDRDINIFFTSLIIIMIGLIIIYSKWWAWYGGACFGPRFFLFVSIVSCLFVAYNLSIYEKTEKRISLINLIVLAIVVLILLYVGFIGHIDSSKYVAIGAANNYALEALTWYVPEFTALIYPIINEDILISKNILWIIVSIFIYIHLTKDFFINYYKQRRSKK